LKVLLFSPGPVPSRTIVEPRQSGTVFVPRKPAPECRKRVFTVLW
jgi:hypothetical protein